MTTVVHLPHSLFFIVVVGILSVAAALPPALAVSTFTLPIYTFRLDLTFERTTTTTTTCSFAEWFEAAAAAAAAVIAAERFICIRRL